MPSRISVACARVCASLCSVVAGLLGSVVVAAPSVAAAQEGWEVPAADAPPLPLPTSDPRVPDRVEPEAPEPRRFALDVGMSTEFPISIGGYVGVELPGRFLLQAGAGVMPSPYSSAINGVLVGVGAYDSNVGSFVQNALSNSFVLRLSGGWRPFRDHGFEILGGYTLMTLGGSATEGDIINAVLAEAHSSDRVTAGSGMTIPLSATLHNVHVTLGWRWLMANDHVVLRASLSYMQCLAANLGVTLPSSASSMQTAVNQELNSVVSPYLTSYVKTPLLGFSAGYRF